jgi:hypothetical protein
MENGHGSAVCRATQYLNAALGSHAPAATRLTFSSEGFYHVQLGQ